MGILKNLVKGMGEDKKVLKAKLKDAEQDRKVERLLIEREKSSNRREFERHIKELEEEKITEALKKIRKEKAKEMFTTKHSILKSDNKIIGKKNIFKDNPNMFTNHKRLFIK